MVDRQSLIDGLGLKSVARTGWLRVGIEDVESVAAHSWGMAFIASQICPDEIDRAKVIEMCIVHDLAEVVTGDITPHDGVSTAEKSRLERAAFEQLSLADNTEQLFDEYEQQVTLEARFVRFVDRLDMALQASVYEAKGADLSEFKESVKDLAHDHGFSHLLE